MDLARWVDTAVVRRSTAHESHRSARREQIVVAAARAIEEYGPGVGTAQIAERAGVARPHVYRHFDSKEDLEREVLRFAADQLIDTVRPAMRVSGTAPTIIEGVIGAAIGWAAGHPNLYRFMAARQQNKETHRARLGRTRFLGEVVAAASAYMRTSEVQVDPPDGVMAGLMGMVDAGIIWWLDHHDESKEEVTTRIAHQVWLIMRDLAQSVGVAVDNDRLLSAR
ncbi:TetR/AcrR family transcriptional regulator [Dietzia maris]|uniref:TetR/AcrR family transcriptional regulator n=1 Tax=Dietzia maris TaxID=37915 RepID=UPI0037C9279C